MGKAIEIKYLVAAVKMMETQFNDSPYTRGWDMDKFPKDHLSKIAYEIQEYCQGGNITLDDIEDIVIQGYSEYPQSWIPALHNYYNWLNDTR